MNTRLIVNMTLAVFAIFIAGAVSGGMLGMRYEVKRQSKEVRLERLPDNVMETLEERLSLSTAQSKKMRPIVAEACKEIRKVCEKNSAQVTRIMAKYYDRLAPDLSSEQAAILESMEVELRERATDLSRR